MPRPVADPEEGMKGDASSTGIQQFLPVKENRQSLAYLAYYVWQIDTQPGAMFGLKMHKTAFDDRHAEGAPKPPS